MRFLIVEDDGIQATAIEKLLDGAFAGSAITICDSEQDFERKRAEWEVHPPDLVIMDLAVRAATPGDSPFYVPPNEKDEKYRAAGFRCLRQLVDTPATARVPVVLHSVFAREDWPVTGEPFPPHFSFVPKGDADALILHIRGIYPNLTRPPEPNLVKRLLSSVTSFKIGPFSIDPRKWLGRRKNS